MEIDLKGLKNILEETVNAKRKSHDIISVLLLRENENLHSLLLSKIASICKKINDTPPVEVLKELEELANSE